MHSQTGPEILHFISSCKPVYTFNLSALAEVTSLLKKKKKFLLGVIFSPIFLNKHAYKI